MQLSFDFYMIEAKPQNLIGDKAYNSDALHRELKKDGVEMIAPHRCTRKMKTLDGRRLLVRCEYYAENFLGFVQLASVLVLLKRF